MSKIVRRAEEIGLTPLSTARRRPRPKLTEDQQTELKEAFDLFDSNKTGTIDYHELKVAIRALGFPIKKEEVLKLAAEYDREGTGRIEFRDFLEIMTEKITKRDPAEELEKAFQLFDEDGSGKITLRNLRHIARELGENLSDDEMQAMIDEFDKDQDGAISQQEFEYIMSMSTI
eukprot:CAMPEP_0204841112 /NCGR_PEP_ID=MMETSP1346-20131115/40697_1 /ASSEMBLY_ACC=CAM_ASM_000771 /TAXON_ID=215587 /ORGANISM="Aplanochytrium stocchinoi, Strain GSBS06" /LENGTH=173 /DNA_ID=CAMNT_0051979027 /DNA_START=228 /DNA_END=749 /DNA_ORIENTATION=+